MDRAQAYTELSHILDTAHPGSPLLSPKHPDYPQVQAMLARVQQTLGMGEAGVLSLGELRSQVHKVGIRVCAVCGAEFQGGNRAKYCSPGCKKRRQTPIGPPSDSPAPIPLAAQAPTD